MLHVTNSRLHSHVFGSLAAAMLVFAIVTDVPAQDDDPFRRPGGAPAPVAAAPASPLDSIEMRGSMVFEGDTYVTLVDTSSSRSYVVVIGGTANGVKVSDYAAADDSVLIESGGNTKRIKMRKATIIAMAVPPPQAAPLPAPPNAVAGVSPSGGAPAAIASASDEEVRARMQRVAEEIRRRREMRREMLEKAQQQQQQPAPSR